MASRQLPVSRLAAGSQFIGSARRPNWSWDLFRLFSAPGTNYFVIKTSFSTASEVGARKGRRSNLVAFSHPPSLLDFADVRPEGPQWAGPSGRLCALDIAQYVILFLSAALASADDVARVASAVGPAAHPSSFFLSVERELFSESRRKVERHLDESGHRRDVRSILEL